MNHSRHKWCIKAPNDGKLCIRRNKSLKNAHYECISYTFNALNKNVFQSFFSPFSCMPTDPCRGCLVRPYPTGAVLKKV